MTASAAHTITHTTSIDKSHTDEVVVSRLLSLLTLIAACTAHAQEIRPVEIPTPVLVAPTAPVVESTTRRSRPVPVPPRNTPFLGVLPGLRMIEADSHAVAMAWTRVVGTETRYVLVDNNFGPLGIDLRTHGESITDTHRIESIAINGEAMLHAEASTVLEWISDVRQMLEDKYGQPKTLLSISDAECELDCLFDAHESRALYQWTAQDLSTTLRVYSRGGRILGAIEYDSVRH